jgi:tRNA threonylcarbamoyladenosine biosynthesis protein TsaE
MMIDNMDIKISQECKSLKDTIKLARVFSRALRARGRAVVLLSADMGAGKTTFVREVVKRLGAGRNATSPTFSIINKYRENVFHVDLYRLCDVKELENTDFHEIINGDNYVFVEWAEKFEIDYPADVIWVRIEVKEGGVRVFGIVG